MDSRKNRFCGPVVCSYLSLSSFLPGLHCLVLFPFACMLLREGIDKNWCEVSQHWAENGLYSWHPHDLVSPPLLLSRPDGLHSQALYSQNRFTPHGSWRPATHSTQGFIWEGHRVSRSQCWFLKANNCSYRRAPRLHENLRVFTALILSFGHTLGPRMASTGYNCMK